MATQVSNSRPSVAASALALRSSKACTICRRMKQRCDALEKFPNACTRCTKRGMFCELDGNPNQRKSWIVPKTNQPLNSGGIAKSNGLPSGPSKNSLEYVKQNIEASISKITQMSNNVGVDRSINPAKPDDSTEAQKLLNQRAQSRLKEIEITADEDDPLICPSERIDDKPKPPLADLEYICGGRVAISKETIEALFNAYVQQFHPLFPIIPDSFLHLDSFLLKEKALLWAICLIASPVVAPKLRNDLDAHVQTCIQEILFRHEIARSLQMMSSILALLLFCNFSVNPKTFQDDRQWQTCAQAMHLSLQLGFHQSLYPFEYNSTEVASALARNLCWIGSTLVVQYSSSFLGVPSTVPLGNCSSFNLEISNSELGKQGRICALLKQASEALGSNLGSAWGVASPESRGLIERSYQDMLSQLIPSISPMSNITELTFLHSKIHIHLFLFIPGTLEEDQRSGVIPMYVLCLQVVKVLQRMVDSGINPLCWPSFVRKTLLTCSIALYRLLSSRYKHLIDENTALNAISDMYRLINATELDEYKSWYIVLIESMQGMYADKALGPNISNIVTRQGAGLLVSTVIEYNTWKSSKIKESFKFALKKALQSRLDHKKKQDVYGEGGSGGVGGSGGSSTSSTNSISPYSNNDALRREGINADNSSSEASADSNGPPTSSTITTPYGDQNDVQYAQDNQVLVSDDLSTPDAMDSLVQAIDINGWEWSIWSDKSEAERM